MRTRYILFDTMCHFVYCDVYHVPLVAQIKEMSMPETLQLYKPELVEPALKQVEDELFALRESGMQELQNLLNSVSDR